LVLVPRHLYQSAPVHYVLVAERFLVSTLTGQVAGVVYSALAASARDGQLRLDVLRQLVRFGDEHTALLSPILRASMSADVIPLLPDKTAPKVGKAIASRALGETV